MWLPFGKLNSKIMYRGQNLEDKTVAEWFGQYTGTLLSIGENNGEIFSNALELIERGWTAVLCEPSPKVFPALCNLHQYNSNVVCCEVAIGDKNGKAILFDSGELLGIGDRALVSTAKKEETERWASLKMPFEEVEVDMVTWDTFLEGCPHQKFQFISIDAEGYDLTILRQMDLDRLDCKCLCIEWNSLPNILYQIMQYCSPLGFKEIGKNQENVILAR